MSDKEKYYDDVIAPKLRKVLELCQEKDISIIASVEFNEAGCIASSALISETAKDPIRMIWGLNQACEGGAVNIDNFFFCIMKNAREKGHSSLILNKLGIPLKPETT